jgi:hypothetical protein
MDRTDCGARRVRAAAVRGAPQCEVAIVSGETHLTAHVRDEAELFGVVERLRDLGAAFVSISIDP